MPYMYSEMQNKLSKTRESPLESMGQIISSRCPKDAMCVIWKESAARFKRRCRLKMLTDDGRTDGRRMPVYYISSPMSLRLR